MNSYPDAPRLDGTNAVEVIREGVVVIGPSQRPVVMTLDPSHMRSLAEQLTEYADEREGVEKEDERPSEEEESDSETLTPVESSNVSAVGYEDGKLVVQFHNGDVWEYEGVDELEYREVLQADSVGSAIHEIKRTRKGKQRGKANE